MTDDGAARVDRLTKWIKANKKSLLDDEGRIAPGLLADLTGKKPSYWSDVLSKRKPSFAAASARKTETALDMPPLTLEGEAAEADALVPLTPAVVTALRALDADGQWHAENTLRGFLGLDPLRKPSGKTKSDRQA